MRVDRPPLAMGDPASPEVLDRLDRIEAMLARLLPAPSAPDAVLLLGEATRGGWFTSGEGWGLARAQALDAARTGEPEPELSAALRAAGVRTSHGLGRWLAAQPSIERGPDMRDGVLWRVRGFEPVGPRETA